MPFRRLLEANVFSLNSAYHSCKLDEISVLLPWEKAPSDITEVNLHFSDDAIDVHKDRTLNYPQVVSQGKLESLIFGSRFPEFCENGKEYVVDAKSVRQPDKSCL